LAPTIAPTPTCTATIIPSVNVRAAPGTSSESYLLVASSLSVTLLGRTSNQVDGYIWYLTAGWDINAPQRQGWIAEIGLNINSANCSSLPIFNQLGTPNPSATPTATHIPTARPTRGPSPVPTNTPTPLADLPIDFNANRYVQRTLDECTDSFSEGEQRFHCWIHVSLFNLIGYLDAVDESQEILTHRILIETLIESEYRSAIDYDVEIGRWGDEAVARQFFTYCGSDGCQGEEVYRFLAYFQAPRNDTLVGHYAQAKRNQNSPDEYFRERYDILTMSVHAVLEPSVSGWRDGVIVGRPAGYGTRGLNSPVDITDNEIQRFADRCGFAAATEVATKDENDNALTGKMFVGTKAETDRAFGGTCSFTD
jgi:hypothetical protein